MSVYCDEHKLCLHDIEALKEDVKNMKTKFDAIMMRLNVTLASVAVTAIFLALNLIFKTV